jgi:16S rRNA (guanine1207-N2)-methyltransferase
MKPISYSNSKSFDLLFQHLANITDNCLWVLDENPPVNCPGANDKITVITNRFDVYQIMINKGFHCLFNDFDFSVLAGKTYQYILYRISKEKALSHYVINQANNLLSKTGSFIISGAKQEGVKGYIDRASSLLTLSQTLKADKQHWAGVFQKNTLSTVVLDDKDYLTVRAVESGDNGLNFLSKPGVFGWNKIDQGSELLVKNLTTLFSPHKPPANILDIGCGYGYLSIHCAQFFSSTITASDNNAAAVDSCRENFKQRSITGQVIATNCTQDIDEKFDLIVCNPPFHTGFDTHSDLTDLFLRGAKKNLAEDGVAVFVVNLHIPLAKKAENHFKDIQILAGNNHFKVLTLKIAKN